MAERKPFKDWFDREAAKRLAAQVAAVWPGFDQRRFLRLATAGLGGLEFHDRIGRFSDAFRATLPQEVPAALDILVSSLPPVLPGAEDVTDSWLQWPLGRFIADHGVPHFEPSMAAMLALTQRFSAEFAVRPFLETYPDETYKRLLGWTTHPSPHVRRWCSEGTRPRLPWGRRLQALIEDPAPSWPLLEALRDDPEPYVRKSVANHLNDISKDHPEAVVDRCRRWLKGASPGRRWIVRHGLRSLVKAGHPGALAALGFRPSADLAATLRVSPPVVCLGESFECHAVFTNNGPAPLDLVVDYRLHFVRQRGRTGPKVFKWKTLRLEAGETRELRKRHPMRPTSIRALYPGVHKVELQVNGTARAAARFEFKLRS